MSTIKVEQIMKKAPGRPAMDALYSFKLPKESKNRFVKMCEDRNLAPGSVLRELLEQFMEGVDHADI